MKALYFKDENTAKDIMESSTALECKHLSKEISDYRHEEWKTVAKSRCKPGIKAKFESNTSLKEQLLDTGEQILGEACQDTLWGTGIPLQDNDCLIKEEGTSTGIMGEILMEICTEIRETPMES